MRQWGTTESIRIADHGDVPPGIGSACAGRGVAVATDAPVQRDAAGAVRSSPPLHRRGWRWVRDMSIGVAVVLAVPLVFIAAGPSPLRDYWPLKAERQQDYLEWRQLMLAHDATISAAEAGAALARVLPFRDGRPIEASSDPRLLELRDTNLFPTLARADDMPAPVELLRAAAGALSTEERDWLSRMATLPLWENVDRVARATEVDLLEARRAQGSEVTLRVSTLAWIEVSAVRRLLVASAARAAWHVSRDEMEAAEAALRALVSLGFALLDGPSPLTDLVAGDQMIRFGRSALAELDAWQRMPSDRPLPRVSRDVFPLDIGAGERVPRSGEAFLAALRDPGTPRGYRIRHAEAGATLVCGSAREILRGPSEARRRELADEWRRLVGTDTESPFIAVDDPSHVRTLFRGGTRSLRGWTAEVIVGSAQVAAAITGNPRIATCTARAMGALGA